MDYEKSRGFVKECLLDGVNKDMIGHILEKEGADPKVIKKVLKEFDINYVSSVKVKKKIHKKEKKYDSFLEFIIDYWWFTIFIITLLVLGTLYIVNYEYFILTSAFLSSFVILFLPGVFIIALVIKIYVASFATTMEESRANTWSRAVALGFFFMFFGQMLFPGAIFFWFGFIIYGAIFFYIFSWLYKLRVAPGIGLWLLIMTFYYLYMLFLNYLKLKILALTL